jgi:hypothetical protein
MPKASSKIPSVLIDKVGINQGSPFVLGYARLRFFTETGALFYRGLIALVPGKSPADNQSNNKYYENKLTTGEKFHLIASYSYLTSAVTISTTE